jgi:hypothetical protein
LPRKWSGVIALPNAYYPQTGTLKTIPGRLKHGYEFILKNYDNLHSKSIVK